MNEPVLCETCLERGRERVATRHGAFGHMCEDCFNGKPFCRAETMGGGSRPERIGPPRDPDGKRIRQKPGGIREYQRRWRAEHPSYQKSWRLRNPERVRQYKQDFRERLNS